VGAVTAALIVAIAISLIAAGKTSSHGCIYVTIPAATGAEQINQCGATARATCLSTSTPGAFAPEAARAVAAECRKAGLPVTP
jgi:predicted acylesterase/phospholipase RssA